MKQPKDSEARFTSEQMFDDPNRFKRMQKRLDEAKRDKNADYAKSFDFFEDPKFIQNAKKDIENYVNANKTISDKIHHFLNIFTQYSRRYNKNNPLVDPDVDNIMKSKRVEYVMTLPRFSFPDEIVDQMSPSERAEFNLVNEFKLYGQKYLLLSSIFGMNVGALAFITLFKNSRILIRLTLSLLFMWLSKVGLLHLTLDKMYYPLLPLFHKYRNIEKMYPEDFKSMVSVGTNQQIAENAKQMVKKSYRNQDMEELK